MSKRIAVLFAEGFEEIEAVAIVDVLRRAEFDTVMAGVKSRGVRGAHGISVQMDALVGDLQAGHLDAVVLPGGMPGAAHLRDSEPVKALLRACDAGGKMVAAICAAPMALEAAGLIKGKRVTCYPGFERELPHSVVTGARVEVDGRIVTGRGPGAAIEFALKLVELLGKPEVARKLATGMIVADA